MDAPYAFGLIGIVIASCLAMSIFGAVKSGILGPLLPALFMLTVAAFVLHTTLRGKFLVWAELLDRIKLRGDERVLDMGCGRGAVLLMIAHRLTTGRAVGVDVWRNVDQSGNSAEATRRNAIAEGVADRVELHTCDMASLPFDNDSFDMVTSSLAIHNIKGRAGREKAIAEGVRVLRPGGRLIITDIRTGQYQVTLAQLGMTDVARSRLGWHFWWGGPWAATQLVTATKPSVVNRDTTST